MPPKGTQSRTAVSTHMSSASQTQAEAQIDPLDTDDNEADEADVAQLRAQIRTLTQGRKDD